MPEFLNRIATADKYTQACTLGPASNVKVLNFSILSQPALAQFAVPVPGAPGKYTWEEGIEREYVANTYGASAQNAVGVRFRSAIAGTPATIVAEMAFANDVLVAGGTLSGVSINSSGQVSPITGPSVTGLIPAAGTTPTAGTGFTYTHVNGSGVYVFTFATPFAAAPGITVQGLTAGNPLLAGVSAVTVNGFQVDRYDNGAAHADGAFFFVAEPIV